MRIQKLECTAVLHATALGRVVRWLSRARSVAVALSLAPILAHGAPLTVTHTFSNGTPADATEVNQNFSDVEAAVSDNDSRITTLESGLQGLELVSQVSAPCTGSLVSVNAVCPAGKMVIGGGCTDELPDPWDIFSSYPSAIDTWRCSFACPGDSLTGVARAMCADH